VLFESEEKNGRIYGYSRNYLRVSVPYQQSLINQKQWVIINKMDADGNLTADLSV
jgi:threonylcarbamoyladenosine tRNA methylthiotransferase MtaB